MRRYRRFQAADYVVFTFLAIGILSLFLHNPGTYLIPIAVFGTIYLLYKFPPDRIRGQARKRSSDQRQRDKARRKASFRVIPGSKHDDDDRPRYH